MILLTDISFFQKPLEIVNLYEPNSNVKDDVNRFIRMYEPQLLQDVLGIELYTALQTALVSFPMEDRFQKLIFGDSYTYNSRQQIWKGIVETEASFSIGLSGATYKNAEWYAGSTMMEDTTTTYPAGVNTITNPAWIGWEIFFFHQFSNGFMRGRDYNYNSATGTLALLNNGSVFEQGVGYGILFLPKLDVSDNINDVAISYKHSFIAEYVYFYYQRNDATFSTGIGEKKVSTSNTTDASAGMKTITAWNNMIHTLQSLWYYLDANREAFPEWYGRDAIYPQRYGTGCYGIEGYGAGVPTWKYRTINTFGI